MCIEGELGIRGYIVRHIWNGTNTQIHGADCVEKHNFLLIDTPDGQIVLPKPLKWKSRDVAKSGKWMGTNGEEGDGRINTLLEELFDEISGRTPPEFCNPWETLGWIEKVASLTREALDKRNMVVEGRMRRRHLSGQSSVMSCEVKRRPEREPGKKESSEVMFIEAYLRTSREAERTIAIRGVVGDIVSEVIDFDKSEGIMIQRNAGVVTDVPWDQEAVISTVLRMQVLSMNRISELEAGGLVVTDSEWLEAHVEWILNHRLLDEACRETENETELKEMLDKLHSRIGEIQKGCRKITSLGLSKTIVHGDMHILNVGSPLKEGEKMYQFFDWARSFVGNPLHDLSTF